MPFSDLEQPSSEEQLLMRSFDLSYNQLWQLCTARTAWSDSVKQAQLPNRTEAVRFGN